MKKVISIIDYTMGNIQSVGRALSRAGYSFCVVQEKNDILKAEHLILPGVGHFGKAMEVIKNKELDKILNEAVFEHKIPITGICLGMQLMTKGSEEGHAEGLGWFDCEVTRIHVNDHLRYKVPHTGWNQLEYMGESLLNHDISTDELFYFVHAYHVKEAAAHEVLTQTTYENKFVSSIKKNHITGFQFHPEKSKIAGMKLLKNVIG